MPLSATPAGRRVLVADDNRDAADSLGMLLELDGHEVHLAYDGAAALETLERVQPEFAILDIGMPGRNGYELAQAVRGSDWGRSIRLIALTGWGQEDDKRRASAAGFELHLTKPVDPDVLHALLAG